MTYVHFLNPKGFSLRLKRGAKRQDLITLLELLAVASSNEDKAEHLSEIRKHVQPVRRDNKSQIMLVYGLTTATSFFSFSPTVPKYEGDEDIFLTLSGFNFFVCRFSEHEDNPFREETSTSEEQVYDDGGDPGSPGADSKERKIFPGFAGRNAKIFTFCGLIIALALFFGTGDLFAQHSPDSPTFPVDVFTGHLI